MSYLEIIESKLDTVESQANDLMIEMQEAKTLVDAQRVQAKWLKYTKDFKNAEAMLREFV